MEKVVSQHAHPDCGKGAENETKEELKKVLENNMKEGLHDARVAVACVRAIAALFAPRKPVTSPSRLLPGWLRL